MATIRDIAKAAGVSASSVSRVINNGPKVGEETRKKILAIIKELGYTPNANAQAINANQKLAIGIVLPNLQQPFFAEMAHGIELVAAEFNAQIMLHSSDGSEQGERQAIETLLEHRFQSMVVHSTFLDDEELIHYAKSAPGLVIVNRYIEQISQQCVWLDDAKGGELMAQIAHDAGHRHFALLRSSRGGNQAERRRIGCLEYLTAKGIPQQDIFTVTAEPTYDGGQQAVQDLIASGKSFTALLAHNDDMAIGAISMLEAQGFNIPRDVSIIGYDNLNIAEFIQPKLTTINNPIEEIAKQATLMALKLNKGSPTEAELKFQPSVVMRNSLQQAQE